MKKNKQIKNLIRKLVEVSFKDERIVESQIIKSVKVLKCLPISQAVSALSNYLKELKRKQRQYTMYIETVTPLFPIQVKKIKKIVEKKHKITKIITQINPEILGGFKIRVGDQIWDETILGKISQVKEVIVSGRSD